MQKRINVWTYWDSEDLPEMVSKCISTWSEHLDPDKFKITVLSEKSVHQFLPPNWLEQIADFQTLNKANQSDFIRLSLLKFHGGVWMDASTYLLNDFSFIESFNKFYAPRFRYIDKGNVQVFFLVAPKDDDTINKWLRLYTDILKNKIKVKNRWYRISLYSGVGLRLLINVDEKFRTYFQIYQAYAELHHSDAVFRSNTPRIDEYGATVRFRKENFREMVGYVILLNLDKLFKRVSSSFGKMLERCVVKNSKLEHYPSITLRCKGKIIFYKLTAQDRKSLKTDFRLEETVQNCVST